MTNTELAILAHRAGFGEKAENQIRIEEFAKLKQFAEAVLAKRTWVGLTDEEIWTVLQFRGYNTDTIEIAKAIEAKLKEKNT